MMNAKVPDELVIGLRGLLICDSDWQGTLGDNLVPMFEHLVKSWRQTEPTNTFVWIKVDGFSFLAKLLKFFSIDIEPTGERSPQS